MNKDVLFSSKSDEWTTPQRVFDQLNEEFHFDLDPATDGSNSKTDLYFTQKQDGLKCSWGGAQSVLQSSVQPDREVGAESIRRGNKRKHYCRSPHSSKNGHEILSRLHSSQERDQILVWKAEVWRVKNKCAVSEHGCNISRAKGEII